MPVVRCPDCDASIELPARVTAGDPVACPNCAGHLLRIHRDAGHWSATLAHRVSCPRCDDLLALGIVGLGAFTGRLDAILLSVLVLFAGLACYRYRIARGRRS